jgi:hypothetical protein
MTLGGITFYFTDSTIWPMIHTVPLWKLIVVMLIGYTILPIPLSMDIRGWQEMHPLNSVGWSLFFEYIANMMYALGIRKLSNKSLAIFVSLSALLLIHLQSPIQTVMSLEDGHSTMNTCGLGLHELFSHFLLACFYPESLNRLKLKMPFCGVAFWL